MVEAASDGSVQAATCTADQEEFSIHRSADSDNKSVQKTPIEVAAAAEAAEPELVRLCCARQWNSVLSHLALLPQEVFQCHPIHGTALAAACRNSAPLHVVQGLVGMCKSGLRNGSALAIDPLRINFGGRGTPLHEAIGNEECDPEVIRLLVHADVDDTHVATSSEDETAMRVKEVFKGSIPLPNRAPRACCTPDVDGQIPLHLMVRRVFRSCPRPRPRLESVAKENAMKSSHLEDRRQKGANSFYTATTVSCRESVDQKALDNWKQIRTSLQRDQDSTVHEGEGQDELLIVLRELIDAYPEGSGVPDNREYEETPLVLTLKASLYASYAALPNGSGADINRVGSRREDVDLSHTLADLQETTHAWYSMLERRINTVVRMIVSAYPPSARHVASSGYTMLHSALFHGRRQETLRLLVNAAGDAEAALLCLEKANTAAQGEVPLHFACMRMEEPEVIRMLCEAGPEAVHCRDGRGRTPLHWLWIRFVSGPVGEQLSADEPPVNFLQMRHVPADYINRQAVRKDLVVKIMQQVLKKMCTSSSSLETPDVNKRTDFVTGFESWNLMLKESGGDGVLPYTGESRNESRVLSFWATAQSLLRASEKIRIEGEDRLWTILHAAAQHSGCPRAIVEIVMALHPDFLKRRDSKGKLPLHCAAGRLLREWRPFAAPWSAAYHSKDAVLVESVLDPVLMVYPRAAHVYDAVGRLPLHYAIESFQKSLLEGSHCYQKDGEDPMDHFRSLLRTNPESIERRDGVTKLYPFMQAAACVAAPDHPLANSRSIAHDTSERKKEATPHVDGSRRKDQSQLSVVYGLLRTCPFLVSSGTDGYSKFSVSHAVSELSRSGSSASSNSSSGALVRLESACFPSKRRRRC